MLGEGGRRRKVEERGRCDGRKSNGGEEDWRGGNEEQGNRDPNDVSYGLLQNIWLSQLLEKHNQVLIIVAVPLEHSIMTDIKPTTLRQF